MGRLLFVAVLALVGCSASQTPTVVQSYRATAVALKGVDVRMKQDAAAWADLAQAATARCSSMTTKVDRKTCLGAIAQSERAAELAAELALNYDSLVELLAGARQAAAELEALHTAALEENAR